MKKILFLLSLWTLNAGLAPQASPPPPTPMTSMVEERSSFNSRDQQGYYLLGAHALDPQTSINVSATHCRTPFTSGNTTGTETYFRETLGASYAMDNTMMLDASFQLSQTPQPQIYSVGGSVGFLINWFASHDEAAPTIPQLEGMSRVRAQFSEESLQELVLSARFGLSINSFTSSALPGSSVSESSYSLDLTRPLSDDFAAGAGIIYYSYSQTNSFYTPSLSDNYTSEAYLLGATIQGLPVATLSARLSAVIADFDSFLPSYSASLLQTSGTWAHTLSANWKHEFSRSWVLTPGYELTMQQGLTTSGFLLDLFFRF